MAEDRQHEQARRLARLLLSTPDEQACLACLDTLEVYTDAQLRGEPYAAQFPAVALHLDTCVACAESYALLYEAKLREARVEPLPDPGHFPAPDLSFLKTQSPDPAAKLRSMLASALKHTSARLQLALSPALLAAYRPPATPALALRGNQPATLFDMELDAPHPAIERLNISASGTGKAPEQCDLRVLVVLPGRDWPDLGGVAVKLVLGEETREAKTDPWGEVVFVGVLLALLEAAQIEIDASNLA